MKNVAVFGYSVMSLEAMSRLDPTQFNLVFVGKNDTEAALVSEKGFATQVIDFRNDDALKSIGIGSHIDILFCFFPTDSENVFLTISARALAANLTIVTIVDEPESAEKLMAAGADKIIDPYEICGRKTYDMLSKPDITDILDNTVFGRNELKIAQVEIPEGSKLINTYLSQLKLHEQHNLILICAVDHALQDCLHFTVGGQERLLSSGDVLVVMGPDAGCKAFAKEVELAVFPN